MSEKTRAKQIIIEIVKQAGGTLDNKTNLYKAFYRAHLKFAETRPGYLSLWPIVRMPNGPGIDRFDLLIGELIAEGYLHVEQVQKGDCQAFRFVLASKKLPDDELPDGAREAIEFGVQAVRGKTAVFVSDASHRDSRSWNLAKDGDELNIYIDSQSDEEFQDRVRRLREMNSILAEDR